MSALILDHVGLRANEQALFAPISIEVTPGTVASVTGASGAGKSSLLAFISGVLAPGLTGRGRVLLGDQDVTQLSPQARQLGMLFQDPLLFPHLSVAGNLLFGLRNGGSRRERNSAVTEALASVDLEGFGERDPATLSGGQKARVALLRVLLSRPRALLLDEPFGALDDDNRQRVRQLVFDAAVLHGLPTLLVTHDKEDVAAAAGPVVTLEAVR